VFQIPLKSLNFRNLPKYSKSTKAPGLTQSLIEISTINLSEGYSMAVVQGLQPHSRLPADCLENLTSSAALNPIGLNDVLQG
jgi:hypothetical protein